MPPILSVARLEDLLVQMREEPLDAAELEGVCWPLYLEDREVAREQTLRPLPDQWQIMARFNGQCWPWNGGLS